MGFIRISFQDSLPRKNKNPNFEYFWCIYVNPFPLNFLLNRRYFIATLNWVFYKMSDNASEEEQQQQMQEIFICADIWLEVFAFVSPLKLGHLLALISERFDVLVDEHFKTRKWSLGRMEILRAIDGNDAEIGIQSSGELLPIPQGPLPNKVIGIDVLKISYIDQTVVEFLQRIRRLFDFAETTVCITASDDQSRSWEIIWQKIWPFVNDNICRFFFETQLDQLRQFSPAILRNCANLRSIVSLEHFPEFPADDNADASSDKAVAKWLLSSREDGRPKMLCCCIYSEEMEELKGSFGNASEPANFIIKLWIEEEDDDESVPFELKNNLTAERLTLRQIDEYFWLLVRCPIGREEAKWREWENEANNIWAPKWNCIFIDFNDRDIGDGMDDAEAGPSEPKK